MVLLDLNAPQLPSWTPLAVAVVMFAALALLWLSMRKHLQRADYPDTDADAAPPTEASAGPGANAGPGADASNGADASPGADAAPDPGRRES